LEAPSSGAAANEPTAGHVCGAASNAPSRQSPCPVRHPISPQQWQCSPWNACLPECHTVQRQTCLLAAKQAHRPACILQARTTPVLASLKLEANTNSLSQATPRGVARSISCRTQEFPKATKARCPESLGVPRCRPRPTSSDKARDLGCSQRSPGPTSHVISSNSPMLSLRCHTLNAALSFSLWNCQKSRNQNSLAAVCCRAQHDGPRIPHARSCQRSNMLRGPACQAHTLQPPSAGPTCNAPCVA
jgi:hypothetical protein